MNRAEVEASLEEIIKSVDDFTYFMPKLIKVVNEFDEEEDLDERNIEIITDPIEQYVFQAAEKCNGKKSKEMVGLAVAMAEKRMCQYYRCLKYLVQRRGTLSWKDYSAEAIKVIETFKGAPDLKMTEEDGRLYGKNKPYGWKMAKIYENCVEALLRAFKRDKIIKNVVHNCVELLIDCLKNGKDIHMMILIGLVNNLDVSIDGAKAKTAIPESLEIFDLWSRKNDEILALQEHRFKHTIAERSLRVIFNTNCPVHLYTKYVVSIWKNALTKELDGQPLTGWGGILESILYKFLDPKASSVDISEFVPGVMQLLKCDIDILRSSASRLIGSIAQKVDALVPYTEELVDVFLENDMDVIAVALKSLYGKCPEKILKKIDAILENVINTEDDKKSCGFLLLVDVAKNSPNVFLPYLDPLKENINHPNIQFQVLMIMGEVSAKYPEKFIDYVDCLLEVIQSQPMTVTYVDKIIASVGTIDKEKAQKALKLLADQLQTVPIVYQSVVLMEMKRIGNKFPDCLVIYRNEIEAMKKSSQIGVGDLVVTIIDFIEGRTLEGLHEEVLDQREDIDNLDTRVTTTENNLHEVSEKVEQHDKDITAVQNDVTNQGEKLEELKEVVDETVVKVDEIDHKTITNAPKWSRDVSKLLNPEADYDWRFLAIRLGYSGEDIRNWALSPDPTMAIMAEWYTTHKSSDATYAILTALEDMGQKEAVKIIEDSLEQADAMVPKSGPDISEKPPKVFISYQWDHQPEVKAIRDHLEMAGFECWMDIGQMGGGDNLYAKINQGMRAAKVVLCMTTDKYSKSENCNKEVNLANLLNKPIIPIIIERTAWPPEGPMSMLFAQLLYIQFFNDKDYTRGEKFWEDSKFSELLGQVSYYAASDPGKITDEYKNWVPTVEAPQQEVKNAAEKKFEIQVDKLERKHAEIEPEVFISYQWDHQPQIKKLYKRLTNLGYSCWLDIKQMGGGDPLYSKIDKGIRKAKVVISCVTPKYSLSANCRREVSLSDALRRPIIPILFQQMTWPPEGPMSMTFTQLLYIDFTKESSQANFDDVKFDELIEKINEHATPGKQVEFPIDIKLNPSTPTPGALKKDESDKQNLVEPSILIEISNNDIPSTETQVEDTKPQQNKDQEKDEHKLEKPSPATETLDPSTPTPDVLTKVDEQVASQYKFDDTEETEHAQPEKQVESPIDIKVNPQTPTPEKDVADKQNPGEPSPATETLDPPTPTLDVQKKDEPVENQANSDEVKFDDIEETTKHAQPGKQEETSIDIKLSTPTPTPEELNDETDKQKSEESTPPTERSNDDFSPKKTQAGDPLPQHNKEECPPAETEKRTPNKSRTCCVL